jgi:hypothetical protein
MSPENEGLDAFAAKFAWQVMQGESEQAVFLRYVDEYPLTSPAFIFEAQKLARVIVQTTRNYRDLPSDEQIAEAYETPIPLDRPIGVRYVAEIGEYRGQPVWRTYALNVMPTETKEQVEAALRDLIEEKLRSDPSSHAFSSTFGAESPLVPMNALLGPLPQRV